MYGLLKGYVSRKPADDDSHEVSDNEGSQAQELGHSSAPNLQLQKENNSGYGRFISWGVDGVSYLGSQVKLRVDKSLMWWSTSSPDIQEDDAIKMATAKRGSPRQPEGTIAYSVSGNDTLAKIALIYDTTPSELTRMNRLTSRMLFPGQLLYVPDTKKTVSVPLTQEYICNQDHENSPATSPTQGCREKIKLTNKVSLTSDDEEEISESFLKIKAKLITDGSGVVSGVILITPHSVIFNPNVSDPLVMDRGRDSYSIKAPMSAVTSAALYKDIAAMAIHDPLKSGRFYLDESTKESISRQNSIDLDSRTGNLNKVKLHATRVTSADSEDVQQNNQKNTTLSNKTNGLQEPVSSSIEDRSGSGNHTKTLTEHEQLITIANELLNDLISDVVGSVCEAQDPKCTECKDPIENRQQLDSNSILLSPLSEDSGICSPNNKNVYKGTKSVESQNNHGQKRHSNCDDDRGSLEHTNKGLSEHCDADTSSDSVMDSTSAGSEKRQSTFFESLSGEVRYWLGVGYSSEDDHAFEEELVPRPATNYEDNLVYLCIKICKEHWCMCLSGEGYRSTEGNQDVMNRDKRRREHWFALPSSRIEHVYGFMSRYCPKLKRTLSHSEEEDDSEQEDEEEDEVAIHYVDAFYSYSPPVSKIPEPETIGQSLTLEVTRPSSCNTKESVITPDLCDDLMFMPEMSTESNILSDASIKMVNKNLPSLAVGHGWTLVYSTFTHGFSLKTLYRNMEAFDTPILLVVQEDEHQIFGVVTSCPLKVSDGFYGTGQSFLFKFEDDIYKAYHWQGDNDFFIKGSMDCIAFGGGGGHFGLWLDEDFYHGSSHFSETYHNETLSKHEDFLCSALEAWTFM